MVKSSKLKSVYDKSTVEDQRRIYREWAETYDTDTLQDFGWMGFKPAATEFEKRVKDKQATILDAGCGTGLSGKALHELGYSQIHGRDLSPEMLEKARKTNVYQSLAEIDLTQPIKEATSFDAIFSCGVFGFGPPFAEHIRHLTALLGKEGYAVITVNGKGWIEKDWDSELKRVVENHGLNLEEILDIKYIENEDIDGKLLIFRGA